MQNSLLKNYRFGFLLVCLLISPIYIVGQDLGSASGIFTKKSSSKKKRSSSKKKKASSKKKKTSSKKKKTSSKKKKTTKKTTAKKRRTSRRTKNRTTVGRKSKSSRAKKSSSRQSAIRRKASSRRKSNTASGVTTKPRNSTQTSKTIRRTKTNNKTIDNVVISVRNSNASNNTAKYEEAIADGNAARNLREYVQAEHSYGLANSINPKDSRAIYGLGNIYSDQQRWEEAERAYRKAIEVEPENPAAHIAISYVLTQPIVGSTLGRRYQEAEKMARKAIVLDPNNAIGYDQLGVALELRGFIGNETENAYRKAIELAPDFALAYAHLGRLLRRHGKTRDSSAAYRKAEQLSKDVPTMILVADVMQSQQRFEKSELLLKDALRQDPKNPTGLYLLGRALTSRKNFDEAEKVLKKSVEVSPNSFVSYTLLGSLYYQSGKLELAEKTLLRAMTVISPNERKRLAQEFEAVGDLSVKANKKLNAVRVFTYAIDLDPSKSSLRVKLAQVKKN